MQSSHPMKPWIQGSKELLEHSYHLLTQNQASLNRIAFICIDNAVELMAKTYLTLPKRLTKITLSRSKINDQITSFPRMLDLLAEVAPQKLKGLDINEIDWFHRVRNDLYHNGHGFLIERKYAIIYGETAKQLFQNLFAYPLSLQLQSEDQMLSQFVQNWFTLQQTVNELTPVSQIAKNHKLTQQHFLSTEIKEIYDEITQIHDEVFYGVDDYQQVISDQTLTQLQALQHKIISINKQNR